MNWLQRLFDEQSSQQLPHHQSNSALARFNAYPPQNADTLIYRANKRASSGDLLGALADFDEAIQCNPTRATAYYNRGFLHNTLGNFEAAIEDFTQALEFLPDYDEAYYQRGNSYFQSKQLVEAAQDFSRAIQLNPYSIKSYYKRAEVAAEVGDISSALNDYTQVITRIPKDANAYYQRGVFLAKIGELHRAIADFSQAISHNATHAEAYCSRGCCYAQLGQIDSARQDFSQALLHNPSSQAAYYQQIYGLTPHAEPIAISASTTSHHLPIVTEVADTDYLDIPPELSGSPSRSLLPENIYPYFERAHHRAIQGDIQGAIQDYTTILELDPTNTQAYYHRGQILHTLGHKKEAIADLEQAIHWARVHSLSLLREFSGALTETITTLKTDLSQPKLLPPGKLSIEETIADCSHTIAQNPTNADAYFRRAQSRALMGDLKGAIADYTETLQLNPNHPEAHYRRALSRSALGDTIAATQDLQRVILHRPNLSDSGTLATLNSKHTATSPQPSHSNCNHAGNRPGNHFCTTCGAPLLVRANSAPH